MRRRRGEMRRGYKEGEELRKLWKEGGEMRKSYRDEEGLWR